MKQKLVVGGAAIALMLGAAGVASAAPEGPTRFANCAEAAKVGQVDIPEGSPLYAAALDRDKDGVACDQEDRAVAVPAGNVADDPDADDDTGGADEGTSTNDDSGAGSEHEGTDNDGNDHDGSDEHDQVEVVPEGGAPTGDGSTEDATGWWIGGGLLAALAGAGVAFRRRLAGLARR